MAVDLNGRWENNFGSFLNLKVDAQGVITGVYGSDTGSSGTYYLVGAAGPNAPTAQAGQNLAVSVFWHPIDGTKSDPSWHWVTTQCGQLQIDGTISLFQSLVATTDFPGLAAIGNYLEKLTCNTTDKGPTTPIPAAPSPDDPQQEDPLNGQWQASYGGPGLSLSVKKSDYGWLCGHLSLDGEAILMRGFADIHAADTMLRGVTLSGYSSARGAAIALNGSLDPTTGRLTLSRWFALSTSSADGYVQTDLGSWVFELDTTER